MEKKASEYNQTCRTNLKQLPLGDGQKTLTLTIELTAFLRWARKIRPDEEGLEGKQRH